MKQLTESKAAAMTREKWDWHYRHPSLKNKSEDFPKIKNGKWKFKWNCPDCEYVKQQLVTSNIVDNFLFENQCKQHCPHIWPEGRCCPENNYQVIKSGHYLDKWHESKTWQKRKKYAKLIRDLSERK